MPQGQGRILGRMTELTVDRQVLRAVADQGDEVALDRLVDLADGRGDLDELAELLDEGSTHAGRLLTRRAVARGTWSSCSSRGMPARTTPGTS